MSNRLHPSSLNSLLRSSFLISNFLFPQCASQLPASIWFHMYVPPGGLSTTSCVYVVSISEFLLHPCASQQLPAWIWFNISASLVSQRLLALIWFQYLTNFPPMCLSSNLLSFLHSLGFNFYTSPVASPQLLAFILFQYLSFLPGAPQQLPAFILLQYPRLPAFIWFYIWFPRGLLKSPPPVPLSNFPHSCGFNIKASPLSSLHSFLHAPSFGFNI